MSAPVIIEAALNGGLPQSWNPRVPRTPQEIAADAIACLDAGATIVHNHNDDPVFGGSGRHAAEPYLEAWRAIVAARPAALLYPTMASGGPHVEIADRYRHIEILAEAGVLAQGLVDPGTTNIGRTDERGRPRADSLIYQNSCADAVYMVETCRRLGLGLSISIFEPGFLRFVLAYHAAGELPQGAFVKLYFGADGALFGLPPTAAALDAYLDMLASTGLPWLVSAQGGDVIECGLAELALRRGGHLQVGLEPSAHRTRSNLELVQAAVKLCASVGRPVATADETRTILDLP
jgi:3-keto-5-aminohexanoate cleavage enzyme